MTVSQQFIITLSLSIAAGMLTVIGVLIIIVYRSIARRLISLGHEDRDIRNQMHSIMELLVEKNNDTALIKENQRLKWLIKTMKIEEKIA